MQIMGILFATIGFILWFALVPLRLLLFIILRLLRKQIKGALAKQRLKKTLLKDLKKESKVLAKSIECKDLTPEEAHLKKRELHKLQAEILIVLASIHTKILLLKLLFILLKLTNKTVKWLSSLLLSMTSIIGAITGSVMMAAIITVVVVPGILDFEFGVNNTQRRQDTPHRNTMDMAFFDIDWSGDFTDLLRRVEDEHGKRTRDWVEFTILGLRVQQQVMADMESSGEAFFTIPGFLNGLKGIETGHSIQDLGRTPIYEQEVFARRSAACRRDWPCVNNGAFQMDMRWEEFNPHFDFMRDLREQRGGMPTFIPDAMYGATLRFSNYALVQNMNSARERRAQEARDAAFKALGITPTPEQAQFVAFATTAAALYNAIFLDLSSDFSYTAAETNDAAFVNALIFIQFAELFGYGITPEMIALAVSLGEAAPRAGGERHPAFSFHTEDVRRHVYGGTGPTGWPGNLPRTGNFGALSETGSQIDGPLIWYIIDHMPQNVQQLVMNSPGKRVFLSGRYNHHARVRYDLTMLIIGIYDINAVYELARQLGH